MSLKCCYFVAISSLTGKVFSKSVWDATIMTYLTRSVLLLFARISSCHVALLCHLLIPSCALGWSWGYTSTLQRHGKQTSGIRFHSDMRKECCVSCHRLEKELLSEREMSQCKCLLAKVQRPWHRAEEYRGVNCWSHLVTFSLPSHLSQRHSISSMQWLCSIWPEWVWSICQLESGKIARTIQRDGESSMMTHHVSKHLKGNFVPPSLCHIFTHRTFRTPSLSFTVLNQMNQRPAEKLCEVHCTAQSPEKRRVPLLCVKWCFFGAA